MKKKLPRSKQSTTTSVVESWTEARVKSFIISVLRGGYRRWPPKYQTLKEASVGKKLNKKTKRMAEHYKCAACGKEYAGKDVNVDHILPVVCPKDGFVNWDEYIRRMYCSKDNLQVLCSDCHTKKTAEERKQRK